MSRTNRSILFIAIFFLYWITLDPFIDLRDPDVLLAQEAGNPMQQVLSLLITTLCLGVLWQNRSLVGKALSPSLVLLLGWQFITVVLSTHPDLSFRRYVFSVTVIITAFAWLLLPENENHFIRLVKPLSLFVLGLAYFGVIFLPAVSIHNLAEVLELTNAGSWRGHFAHKNLAGPAMVVLSCYGMYLWRAKARFSGALITISALFFLYKTNSKTSIGLVVLAFVLAYCLVQTRSLVVKALMVYVPLLITAYLTLGIVLFPSAKSFAESFTSDPTFTGRTEIWKFVIRQLADHPLVGYGYDAFWGTSRLVNGGYDIETWAARAGHAHNAYLNITITTGFIGLALLIWWIGVRPLLDFHRAQQSGNSLSLALMYLQIWLFIMFYANLETPFFVARGPVWFSLLTAVMGMRLHACTVQKNSGQKSLRKMADPSGP